MLTLIQGVAPSGVSEPYDSKLMGKTLRAEPVASLRGRNPLMEQLVFSNIDLVRLIYSFGDPYHRKFTESLKWDLRPWPEVLVLRYIDRKLISGHSYTMIEYLDEYDTRKIEQMVSTYKRCYCCSRHNTNKPMWVNKGVILCQSSVIESHSTECDCSCRMLSRMCIKKLLSRLHQE